MSPLQQSVGAAHTRILSLGAARGDTVVSNDDIAGPIDSSDEGFVSALELLSAAAPVRTKAPSI